jgi:hypothetical protein
MYGFGNEHNRFSSLNGLSRTISAATLPQMAIGELTASGGYGHYLRGARNAYAAQVLMMTQAVRKYFREHTNVTRPAGGTVLRVEFPEQVDAVGLYRKVLEKNISIVPGPLFSPRRQYRNCVRLNCGHPCSERTEEAMITLGQPALRMMWVARRSGLFECLGDEIRIFFIALHVQDKHPRVADPHALAVSGAITRQGECIELFRRRRDTPVFDVR